MKEIVVFFILISLGLSSETFGQTKTIRVFFRDKGPDDFNPGSELYQSTLSSLSERAIKRRLRTLGSNEIITYEDAPLYQPYIDKVKELGGKLVLSLKWRNYAVLKCDSLLIEDITKLNFVKSAQYTTSRLCPQELNKICEDSIKFNLESIFVSDSETEDKLIYGASYNQVHLMGADKLHELGITGDSVLISVMDSGFRWKTHKSTKKSKVIYEYDFLQQDSCTSDEKDDVKGQNGHGTLCFSTIAAYYPGELIGIAPSSNFILSKTESIPFEILLEEDNYAASLEMAESMGADMSSSSLAYQTFNETDESYSIDDFDGKTSISALALNGAVKRGMICLTAAGNTGPKPRTILTPGDADSAITVGAVKIVKNIIMPPSFTSRGPTSDSIIKPDISALGVRVACASPGDDEKFMTANGTSLATPLVAGATALMLSCFPELRPWEVRKLLYSTASKYPMKNNVNGYGIINIWEAMRKAGTIVSQPKIYPYDNFIRIELNIVTDDNKKPEPYIYLGDFNRKGQVYKMYNEIEPYIFVCDIPKEKIKNAFVAKLETGLPETHQNLNSLSSEAQGKNFTFKLDTNTRTNPAPFRDIDSINFKNDNIIIDYPQNKKNMDFIDLKFKNSKTDNLMMTIYNSEGLKIYSDARAGREPGIVYFRVPKKDLAIGVYYILITTSKKAYSARFSIK